jgi:hypothetical protein
MALTQRPAGAESPAPAALYTRYCAAPPPAHPIREPSYVHALLVAAWLGRLIDPLPHGGTKRKAQPAERRRA